jgi:F-type H+-transporting ATPase subunit b
VISLDYTLGFQIINFLLLIFILNILLYKPILGIIAKREKRLAEADAEVDRLRGEMEQKLAEYEGKARLARQEATEQAKVHLKEGAEEAKKIVEDAREEITSLMEDFHRRMEGEIGAARKVLSSQSLRISREIAEKVLGRAVQ